MGMSTGRIPTTDNIPETTEKLGFPADNIPEKTEKLGCSTDFLKHLILSYSFEIKQINERTNIYLKFYFKIIFLSHNNVVFVIKSKSKILKNSLKSAYNLAYLSYILIDTIL
jgi:hypothetical protein